MKVLLIDNEENIITSISSMLQNHCEGIKEINYANGVKYGIAKIEEFKPNIVFLDVEMDDGTGFDLVSQLKEINFQLIFVTAHNKYAINAFKFSAIDFIQKPVDIDDLITAFNKAKSQIHSKDIINQFQILKDSISNIQNKDQKIVLKDNKSIYFIQVNDIFNCEAEGSYTTFHLVNNQKITVSKPLKEYELLLETFGFFRPHNSHLVNSSKITRLDKANGGLLILNNKAEIPISQRKWDYVLQLLDKH